MSKYQHQFIYHRNAERLVYLVHGRIGVLMLRVDSLKDGWTDASVHMFYREFIEGVTEGPPLRHHYSWLEYPAWCEVQSGLQAEEDWVPRFQRNRDHRDMQFHEGILNRLETQLRGIEKRAKGGEA